jgi:predicted amidohydrolase
MRISVVQPDIVWENKTRNFRKYERMISQLHNPDIVVLPEMFSTGFTASSENQGEPPKSETFDWMIHMAEKSSSGICGSYIIKIGHKYVNRFVFVSPEKKSWFYDKRHTFRMSNVEDNFTPGNKRLVFKFRGFRICPGICYDLRFPVWTRNRNDYDLLLNSANWPMARRDVWITLLKARAIENLSFVAGANRIGTDGTGTKYCGDSLIFGPKGEEIASAGMDIECSITADISLQELKSFRKKFPAHLDADRFSINL